MDLNANRRFPLIRAFFLGGLLAGAVAMPACVTRSRARTEARMAYLAGQNDALMRLQQQQSHDGRVVTMVGPVRNMVLPWSADLTLAKAIFNAGYLGSGQPSAIIIHRNGGDIPIDMKRFLAGDDYPLEAGDSIELRP